MMTIVDVEKITKVLEGMMRYELAMSDFYKTCADTWKEDEALWQNLSNAEIGHAENIKILMQILLNKTERFELGRPFNLMALQTAQDGLKNNIKKITEGAFSHEKILILARDIEQSMLEAHYAEIVKTGDLEYQSLMKKILSQTYEHKMIIQKKIDEIRSHK